MIELDPFQSDALARSAEAMLRGCRRQLIVHATGGGKTVVASMLRQHHDFRGKIMFLTHREKLANQTEATFQWANPGYMIGMEMADRRSAPMDTFIIGSVPTLGKSKSERIKKFDPAEFSAVISDEAHHAISPEWMRVLDYFGLLEPDTPHGILSLGMTATPNRADGNGLRRLFDEIVHTWSLMDGIDAGYLADLEYYKIKTHTNLDGVKTRAGDWAAGELEKTVNTPERNAQIVREWFARCQRQKTLAFCVDVQHALDLAEAFKAHGVAAEAVWGEDPDRNQKFDRFRDHESTLLTNCQLATEGFDDWSIMWGIMARPTRSALLYQQMLGRLTRIPPEVRQQYRTLWKAEEAGFEIAKRCAGVLDFVDNCRHPAVSLPYLIGLPAEMDIKGKSVRKAKEQFDRVAREFPTANLQDVKSIEELASVAEKIDLFKVSYPVEVQKLTELAWRKAGDGYFLPVDRSRITIAQDLREDWWVRGTVNGKQIEIAAQNLAGAFNAADAAVMEAGGKQVLLARDSRWRQKPVSPKTIELMRKCKLPILPGLTQEQASAALDAHFQKRRING